MKKNHHKMGKRKIWGSVHRAPTASYSNGIGDNRAGGRGFSNGRRRTLAVLGAVPAQLVFPVKRPVAAREFALVLAIASMDALVLGEIGRLAKLLVAVGAFEWPHFCVGANVHS
jgi:hypothetical protein